MARKKISTEGKYNGKACTQMREAVFGAKAQVEVHQIMERAVRMRDDAGLLEKAKAKRAMKLAKRVGK